MIDINPSSVIRVSSSHGTTGKCFHDSKLRWSMIGDRESSFNPDLDNLTPISNVTSFLISNLKCGEESVGVLQLINKITESGISQFDLD